MEEIKHPILAVELLKKLKKERVDNIESLVRSTGATFLLQILDIISHQNLSEQESYAVGVLALHNLRLNLDGFLKDKMEEIWKN